MDKWLIIQKKLHLERNNFKKAYKCISQNRYIKPDTVRKHLENLVNTLESIRKIIQENYSKFTNIHQKETRDLFWQLRDLLVKIIAKYNIKQDISHSLSEPITLNFNEILLTTTLEAVSEETTDSDTDIDSDQEVEMTQNIVEFLNTAARLVTDFDGKPENLRSFLDALALLDTIKGEHETTAISLIKTKLKGNARNLITAETTIAAVIATLQRTVKGESVEVISAKIMNIRQNSKPANNYCNEIETLTKSLENAYITDGLSTELASRYSTQIAVKAMTKNCSLEKVKLIMEAGQFNNMNEAISKFIGSCTETTSQQNTILHFGQRPFNNSNNRFPKNARFQRRNNFSNHQNRAKYNGNYSNNSFGNSNQNYGNSNRGRFRPNRQNQNRNVTNNVRCTQSEEINPEN